MSKDISIGTTGSVSISCRRSGRQNECSWRVNQIRGHLGWTGYGPAGKARAVALALRVDRLLTLWRKA